MILATIKQFNQKQLILVQGEDSKKGHLIYLTRKGSFQVILYKMIRFLSGKLKKHTKLAKIVKISIFVNWLVFPMNFNQFNRFSHPMTHVLSNIIAHMKTDVIRSVTKSSLFEPFKLFSWVSKYGSTRKSVRRGLPTSFSEAPMDIVVRVAMNSLILKLITTSDEKEFFWGQKPKQTGKFM